MKFTKPGVDTSKKNKASLKDKSKFKSKDAAAPNGKLQKGAKTALDLVKKGSFDGEMGALVKGKANKSVPKKKETKAVPEPAKLSPEVRLGLKLDKILEKKAGNKPTQSTPTKTGKRVDSTSSASPTNTPAKPKRKKKKGKKNSGTVETSATDNDTDIKESTNGSFTASESPVPSKKGRKRKAKKTEASSAKNQNLSQSNNLPTEEKPSKGAKQRKNKKKPVVDSVAQPSQPPPTVQAASDPNDFTLNSKDVVKAVKSALDLYKKNTKANTKLLDSEPEPLFLKFLFFLPHTKQKIIRFDLSHSLVRSTSDICLFVSDTARKNVEESKSQWEQILRDENVTDIAEVIPLRSLVTEYKQYQDKRKLSDRFDFFLSDAKIAHRVFGAVGLKFFHSRRRTPTPVPLKKGAIKENIKKALLKSVSHYSPTAETFTIQVGHTDMDKGEVERNIARVWEQYPQQFGVYWENIRRMSLFAPPHVPELPLFCSMNPPEGKPRVYKTMKWTKESKVPVVGELSTALDKKVLVYPSGKVVVKSKNIKTEKSGESSVKTSTLKENKKLQKPKDTVKSESDEETDLEDNSEDEDEEDISTSGESEEEMEVEQKKQPAPGGKKNSKKSAAVAEVKSKGKQEKVVEHEGEEDIVDRAEEMYLRDLAVEKKLKKNNEKPGKTNKLKGKKEVAQDSDDSDSDCDNASDDEKTNSLGNSWHDDDVTEDSSEDDIEVPPKKQTVKGNKKMNGVNQPKTDSQTSNKAQKKSGAMKNSPPRRSNKKQPKKQSPSAKTQNVTADKKNSGLSYQGVKTNNTKQKNKKQGQTVKNKMFAKKLAK